MMRRLPHRFRSLPIGPGHVLIGWPQSLRQVEAVSFVQPCSAAELLALADWAGLNARSARAAGISMQAVRRLTRLAAFNGYSNQYHQSGHFAHVIIAAGLLAAASGLKERDVAILVLAALVHDLDHHGRRSSRSLYAQEIWSAQKAARVLQRFNSNVGLSPRLARLLRATALTNDTSRKAILNADPLARLLTDADIFASVFFGRKRARSLTRLLKLEQGLAGTPDELLAHFLSIIQAEGLQSSAACAMLSMLDEVRNQAD